MYFGPNDVSVTADVAPEPDLDTGDIDDRITDIEATLRSTYEGVTKGDIEPET